MVALFSSPFAKKRLIKVLIIEDSEDDALLLVRQLRSNGFSVQHQRVETAEALEQALSQPWDLVLSDHSLPTMDGIEALKRVRVLNRDVPFVFVSGTIGEELAVEAIRMGAQDYVLKDKLNRLAVVVRRELQDARLRNERRNFDQQINYLARYDNLTGLPNRFTFMEHLKSQIDQYVSGRHVILVLYIQLKRLKSISGDLEHTSLTALLQEVTNRLHQFVGDQGLIARLSNHEFALVHTGFSAKDPFQNMAEDLVSALAKPYMIAKMPFYCGACIGGALYPGGAFDAGDIMNKAEIAAIHAEQSGGSSVCFFTADMAHLIEQRVTSQRALREALENNEFMITYQPQVDTTTEEIASLAAVIEWHSPAHGLTRGEDILSQAKDSGFIFLLGEWAIRQVCQQIKLWEYSRVAVHCIAVPVAARQFHEDNLVELLRQLLKEYDLSPKCLRLVISDTAIMRDSEKASAILQQLRYMGIKVALDNFGSQFSNLSHLKNFISDFICIGPQVVQTLGKTPEGDEALAEIMTMAHKFGIKTIGKGVESAAQYAWLKRAGCSLAQGPFLGEAMDPQVIRERLRNQSD